MGAAMRSVVRSRTSSTSQIPVVMLGVHTTNFDEQRARQSGADEVMMKPFKTDDLDRRDRPGVDARRPKLPLAPELAQAAPREHKARVPQPGLAPPANRWWCSTRNPSKARGLASPTPISPGPASLGPVSPGPASLGPASLGPVSLGPVSLGPVSLGPAPRRWAPGSPRGASPPARAALNLASPPRRRARAEAAARATCVRAARSRASPPRNRPLSSRGAHRLAPRRQAPAAAPPGG